MNLRDIIATPHIHVLPLQYTQYQRTLLDILGRLHKNHILKVLDDNYSRPHDGMSDDAMFDAFVFNSKQIINHPTMIVDHYMPKNLLLLNTKQNIVSQSQKYHYLNELLDHLSDADIKKTVVLSVTNSKEMDLLEAILIGKAQLQYYRFSGTSLYYEKNGAFDINQKLNNDSLNKEVSLSPEKLTPKVKARHNIVPQTKPRGRGRPRGRGGRVGRPPNRAAQLANDDPSVSSSDNNSKNNVREEYIQKLSKNNPLYNKKNENAKLKIYLVLSKQLKHLSKVDELKPDLLVLLDSNNLDFDSITNAMGNTPIIKPLVINSLEHYEWKLRNLGIGGTELSKYLTFLTLASYPDTKINDMPVLEEFVPLSKDIMKWIFSGCPKDEFPYSNTFETCVPLKFDNSLREKVKDVLLNYKEPSSLYCPSNDPKFTFFDAENNKNIIEDSDDKMNDINGFQNNDVKPCREQKYSLNYVETENKPAVVSTTKKFKPNPIHLELKKTLSISSYREYQYLFTRELTETMRLMKSWMLDTETLLDKMHLSESFRQLTIDANIEKMGELYKKDRDLGITIENKSKLKDRNEVELQKLQSLLSNDEEDKPKGIQNRYRAIESIIAKDLNEETIKIYDEKNDRLKKIVKGFEDKLECMNTENDAARQKYQEKSSAAADVSSQLNALKTLSENLEKQSNGKFDELKLLSFENRDEWLQIQLEAISRETEFMEKYISLLETVNEKKQKNNGYGSTRNRNSRNNTPH